MKTIMIIGAGKFQLPAIEKARELGYKVVAVDGSKEAIGLKKADEGIVCDIKDKEKVLELAKQFDIDGVLTLGVDAAVRTISFICSKLGLPGISEITARAVTNKGLMRQTLRDSNIPVPEFFVFQSFTGVEKFVNRVGLPVVVKPTSSSGSRGVQRVTNMNELHEAFMWSMKNSPNREVIIEKFMEGLEVSVEMFSYKGKHHVLGVAEKRRTPPPYQIDTHVIFPCTKPEVLVKEIENMAKSVATALDIDFGPSHAELILTEEGPRLVEIAARGAGCKVYSDILRLITGIDTMGLHLQACLGENITIEKKFKHSAILGFLKGSPGILQGVKGVENLLGLKGIYEIEILRERGEAIKTLTSGAERDGYYIVYAEDSHKCLKLASKVEETIKFESNGCGGL